MLACRITIARRWDVVLMRPALSHTDHALGSSASGRAPDGWKAVERRTAEGTAS
jgi:hypothetical protein